MNLIIKDISKEKAEEIVNNLDKLIDDGAILDWRIDEGEAQDYHNADNLLGERVAIKPYYRNNALCFAFVGHEESTVKHANIIKFLELLLEYFPANVKSVKIINL
ncbi:MAG: hypothetical protein LBQ34_01145 [Alphaproteobacteria bacterium]|jgi:hypothetical protein|nr:hypothetical protein [Alphaproteobacteria bacterium]